jgi:hypothetical protein
MSSFANTRRSGHKLMNLKKQTLMKPGYITLQAVNKGCNQALSPAMGQLAVTYRATRVHSVSMLHQVAEKLFLVK